MTTLAPPTPITDVIDRVIIEGDLSKLSAQERIAYYRRVCDTIGVNPLTKPLDYITLNGRLTLYAKKDCTDQLRAQRHVSVNITSRERIEDIYVVTARATTADGRTDESIGAVNIANLKGDALANAIMKAETKAKRRVTLSIIGLGWLDETEIETIADAKPAPIDAETGEIKTEVPPAAKPARPADPETVKDWLTKKAAKGAATLAPQALRGATVGALELLFPNDNDDARSAKRHMLTGFFFSKPKSDTWTDAECRALSAWATEPAGNGQYITSDMAIQEAAKIITWLDQAEGQRPLM